MSATPPGGFNPFPFAPPLAKGARNPTPRERASHPMKLISGNSNLPLARAIADYLELPLADTSVRRFADEEVFVEIHENVRGQDVRSEEHTSELQSLMTTSYAVFCLNITISRTLFTSTKKI